MGHKSMQSEKIGFAVDKNVQGDMRVVLVITDFQLGGAERVFCLLANHFATLGIKVDFVVFSEEGRLRDLIEREVKVHSLGGGYGLSSILQFRKLLRHLQPDLVLSALEKVNFAALLACVRLKNAPPIVTTTHIHWESHYSSKRVAAKFLFGVAARLLYPRAAARVAVSESARASMRNVLGESIDIRTINNPIDVAEISRWAAHAPSHPWCEDPTVPLFICVGRLAPQKDYPTAIRAFRLVRDKIPCRLLICGSGPERPGLERLIAELGLDADVAVPGIVFPPYPEIARARALVLSSRYEGQGVVLLEAIACGCPIVSTDCPGAREVLASGAVGLIAKMGDAVDLSKRMLEILDVSPDRRSLMARSQEFSVERVGQAYLELLASIISHQEPKTGRRWTNLPSARGMD